MKQCKIEEYERKSMFSRMIQKLFRRMAEPLNVSQKHISSKLRDLVCTDFSYEKRKYRGIGKKIKIVYNDLISILKID